MLCLNGDVLEAISTFKDISLIIRQVHIFSRTSPNQKDFIVANLNKEGYVTMMCGDGTNDVGSLKRSNVGLAIVNNKDPSKEDKKKRKTMSMWLKPADFVGLTQEQIREKQKKHMEEYMKTMQTQMGGPDSGMPELGDACIAAPFTFKFSSLRSVIKLIQ
jgi:cation-transporting ATPase 13A1